MQYELNVNDYFKPIRVLCATSESFISDGRTEGWLVDCERRVCNFPCDANITEMILQR